MLSDKKQKLVDLIIEGKNTKVDMAKLIGVSRQTLYDYLECPEVQAEIDKRLTEIRTQTEKKIIGQIEPVVDELFKIALTATGSRERKDACIYLLNRVLGTPKAVLDVNDDRNKEDNIDVLAAFDSVVNGEDTDKEDESEE